MPCQSSSSIYCLCCPVVTCFGWLLCLAGSVTSSFTFCMQDYHRPRPSTTEVSCSNFINRAKQVGSGDVLFCAGTSLTMLLGIGSRPQLSGSVG